MFRRLERHPVSTECAEIRILGRHSECGLNKNLNAIRVAEVLFKCCFDKVKTAYFVPFSFKGYPRTTALN